MLERRLFKQTTSLKERLTAFSEEARQKATELPPGPERDEMLRKLAKPTPLVISTLGPISPGLRPPA